MLMQIGNTENPKINNLIVMSELPSTIDYVLLNNGTCIVSEQLSKKLGGLKKS